jgi:hypothetical protein
MDGASAQDRTNSAAPPFLNSARGRSNLLGGAILVTLGVLLATALFFYDPAVHRFYPQCVLYRTTGILCPGCGGLRAVHHLLHGEIESALRFNALLVLFLPFAAVLAVRAWLIGRSPNPVRTRVPTALIWCVLAITAVFGLFRNTPFAHAMGLVP